jgi:basic membrane lipoprotein Med (substrate-binding protein (PBP1-ABC) superfamily)
MNRGFLIVLLSACLTGVAAGADTFRVAMVLPGSDTDKGWNQMAAEGLAQIKKDLHAETRLATNVQSADFYNRLSDYAEDGFDVVICHGGEFEKPAAKAAAAYPKTHFIVGGCPSDIPGAISVEFLAKDASQLVGLVAGELTQSHTVAFVGADPVAPLQACYDGMSDGLAADGKQKEVKLLPALWTHSWDSPTVAREKTEAAIASGADIIYQNVDAAAWGVFQAVQDADKSGKKIAAFGCNSNQNALAPDVILGSVVLDVPRAYFELARDVHSGKVKAGALKFGLAGGYVDLVLNDKHPLVNDALRQKVEALRKKLTQKSAPTGGK